MPETDAGSGDDAADVDAGPGPGPSCTDGTSCDIGGDSGVCTDGECAACSGDAMCQSAYGTDYSCSQGSCVLALPSGCVHDTDCDSGQVCDAHVCVGALAACQAQPVSSSCGQGDLCCTRQAGVKCVDVECCVNADCVGPNAGDTCSSSGVCVPPASTCAPPAGDYYYVDPGYVGPSTGSNLCPFKTIHGALSAIRNDDNPNFTEVRLKAGPITATTEGGADQFPLSLPAGTAVHSSPLTPRVVIIAPADTSAFTVAYSSTNASDLTAHIHDVEIKQASQGSGGAAVVVVAGSSAHPVQIDHVEIHNFNNGINVGASGYVNLNFDVNAHDNKANGLFVGGGRVKVTETAGGVTDHFDHNDTGIWVTSDPASTLIVDSVADGNGAAMVTASTNTSNGLHLASPSSGNSITHLAANNNGKSGLVLFGGSKVVVRYSNIKNNGADGVHIVDNGTTSSLSDIDLGVANTDNGFNFFDGNANTSICDSTTVDGTHLHAGGNTFVDGDCSVVGTAVKVRHFWDCSAHGGGVGENGVGVNPFSIPAVGVNNCDYAFQ